MLMQHEVVRSFRDWHGPWRKVPKGKIQYEGERPKPLHHPKVCTLVCTLAYSNPVYGQKIVLGISGRIPCSTLRIAKIGACALGSQSLAQGGPFTEKISSYAGFLRINEARDSADTNPIRT